MGSATPNTKHPGARHRFVKTQIADKTLTAVSFDSINLSSGTGKERVYVYTLAGCMFFPTLDHGHYAIDRMACWTFCLFFDTHEV